MEVLERMRNGVVERWGTGITGTGFRKQRPVIRLPPASCILHPVSCILHLSLRVLRVPSFVIFAVKNEDLGIREHGRGINILI